MANLTNKNKILGVYYPEWAIYKKDFTVDKIPVNQITHIFYAFMLPNPNQADYTLWKNNWAFPMVPYDPTVPEGILVAQDAYANEINIPALRELKVRNPHIKILISVGGWSMSFNMSNVFSNPTTRKNFVTSAVDFIIKNGFDGIDLDWEYPGKQGIGFNHVSPNDPIYLALTLQELRSEFVRKLPNKNHLLTIAMGCSPDVIQLHKNVHPYVDYINAMTYDFAGAWGDGGHLAGLYNNPAAGSGNSEWNVSSAIQNILNTGFPANKINLGLPFYGRGWKKIVPNDPNLPIFGPSVGGDANTYSGGAGEPGLTNWKDLVNVVNKNGLTQYYDPIAKAYFAHNISTGETWSYDTPETIANKTRYALEKTLAGVFVWEITQDAPDVANNLLTSVVNVLNSAGGDNPPVDPIFKLEVKLILTQTSLNGGTGKISISNIGTTQTNWSIALTTNNFVIDNATQFIYKNLGNNNITISAPANQAVLFAGQTIDGTFTYSGTNNYSANSNTNGAVVYLTFIPFVPPVNNTNLSVVLTSTNSWTGNPAGGNGTITITNNSNSNLANWSFQLTTDDFIIQSFWNLTMIGTGKSIVVKPPGYSTTLGPNQSITSGFGYTGSSFTKASTDTPGVKLTIVSNSNDGNEINELNFKVNIKNSQFWGAGGNGQIVITNNSDKPISNWSFTLETKNFIIQSFWSLGMKGSGNSIIVIPPSWGSTIAPGISITSGFGYIGTNPKLVATTTTQGVNIVLN